MHLRASFAAAACIALAACSPQSSTDEAVNITANATDGQVSVRVPGIAIDTKLPAKMFASSDFDIEGVKLPSGAKVGAMDVQAGGKDTRVRLAFTAPGDMAAVRKHFIDGFAAKSIGVVTQGDVISGKTDGDNQFSITLSRGEANTTKGEIAITDPDRQ